MKNFLIEASTSLTEFSEEALLTDLGIIKFIKIKLMPLLKPA